MFVHQQPQPRHANCGLLHEIQEQIMEAQAELMDLGRRVLSVLRKLKDAQFALTMQIGAGQAVVV